MWTVMLQTMADPVVSGVMFTPPASTYLNVATPCLPALRGEGQSWFGVPELPADIRATLRDEDLIWLRTGEALGSLTRQGKPWTVVFERLSSTSPTDLLTVKEAMRADGVEFNEVKIRAMTVGVISWGWSYTRKEYEDLEAMYLHITSTMFAHAPKHDEQIPTHTPRDDCKEARAWKGRLRWEARLKPQSWDDEQEARHIGGLRDVALSLDKLPAVRERGLVVGRALEKLYRDEPWVLSSILDAVRNKIEDCADLEATGLRIAECIAEVVSCDDLRRGGEQGLHCEVRPQFIGSWRKYAGDPDDQVESWFSDGSPLGIVATPEARNIFPEYANRDAAADPATLASELMDGRRKSARGDPHAVSEIDKMLGKKWLLKFDSKMKAKKFARGKVVISELIVITKNKTTKVKNKLITKVKKRLILNLKKSGVTAVAVKSERPELPRALDVVFSNLELMKRRRKWLKGRRMRHVILDFANAFFHFPCRPDERKFFCTRLGKSILMWLRAAQGSRGAPLVCGRALALVMRLAASTIPSGAVSASTYVDDPIAVFIGEEDEQDLNVGKLIGSILAMGVRAGLRQGPGLQGRPDSHMDFSSL